MDIRLVKFHQLVKFTKLNDLRYFYSFMISPIYGKKKRDWRIFTSLIETPSPIRCQSVRYCSGHEVHFV